MSDLAATHQPEQHRFVIFDADTLVAELNYSPHDSNRLVITHTGVDPAYGGQGLGQRLIDAAVAHARATDLKIQPVCSFVATVFQRKGEAYADVRSH
jgi:predicted GNAT family acetyltransferase